MRAATLVLLGLAAGFVGAILQTFVLWLGDVPVPVGAAAVLVVVVLLARASAWWVRSRWGAIVFSASWLAATLVMSSTTPGGDVVLTSGTRQIAYLILGGMLLAAACGFPLLPEDDEPAPLSVPAGADEDPG
jgi:hypothetical protein